MNYLTLLTLFPKKINVTFIDADSNKLICKSKMLKENLPEVFNRPTVLNIEGEDWQVLKADPISGEDFNYTRKLMLFVKKKIDFDKSNRKSLLPTISSIRPAITSESSLFTIQLSQWLQFQFLPDNMMPIIQNDLLKISAILDAGNNLSGYEQVYIRENIPHKCLDLPLRGFLDIINANLQGPIEILDIGTVADSFIINAGNHSYYGITKDDIITTLCLLELPYIDDELTLLTKEFQVVLVDWCSSTVISC